MNGLAGSGPRSLARVLIVIVNYKSALLTVACLRSLQNEVAAAPWIRVVVVENASGEGEVIAGAIHENGWSAWASLLVAERNGGFSYGNNLGIESTLKGHQPPEFIMLLNPDTEVRIGAVRALVDFMDMNPGVGIAGSSFESEDGAEWPIAFRFPNILSQFEQGIRFRLVSRLLRNWIGAMTMDQESAAPVDWVAGASMMIRRKVFDQIGLLDEGYFLYFEELDFCLRARRAGWPCWYVPQSRVMHISGQSTGVSAPGQKLKRMPAYWFESRSRFFVKNYGLAYARLADLAFGIGLTLWTFHRALTGRPITDPPKFCADFWRTSVVFRRGGALLRNR